MTDEQIKLNAEVYANTLLIGGLGDSPKLIAIVSFEEGAHSRDEEVAKLENALHNVNELCHQQHNKIYELRHPG